MKIPRLSDRFLIHLGEISVEVSPLSGREKIELAGYTTYDKGKIKVDRVNQEHYIVKHTVKKLIGVTDYDDKPFELEFEGNVLTDQCADEVLALLSTGWFRVAVNHFIGNDSGKILNPVNGEPLDGVYIDRVTEEKIDDEYLKDLEAEKK